MDASCVTIFSPGKFYVRLHEVLQDCCHNYVTGRESVMTSFILGVVLTKWTEPSELNSEEEMQIYTDLRSPRQPWSWDWSLSATSHLKLAVYFVIHVLWWVSSSASWCLETELRSGCPNVPTFTACASCSYTSKPHRGATAFWNICNRHLCAHTHTRTH